MMTGRPRLTAFFCPVTALLMLLAGCSAERRVGEVPVEQFVTERTALVISGRVIDFTASAGGGGLVIPPGHTSSAAVAITGDGYLLTAAHAVAHQPVYVVSRTKQGIRPVLSRVIWTGAAELESDLALLHVEGWQGASFQWSERLKLDQVEVMAATLRVQEDHLALEQLDGKVIQTVQLDPTSDLPARELVLHDAPLRQGFSGGPLFNADGRLLGVNVGLTDVTIRGGYTLQASAALRPSAAWLQQLIDRDRAATTRPATRPTTRP